MNLFDTSTNSPHYFYWKHIGKKMRIWILIFGFKGLLSIAGTMGRGLWTLCGGTEKCQQIWQTVCWIWMEQSLPHHGVASSRVKLFFVFCMTKRWTPSLDKDSKMELKACGAKGFIIDYLFYVKLSMMFVLWLSMMFMLC